MLKFIFSLWDNYFKKIGAVIISSLLSYGSGCSLQVRHKANTQFFTVLSASIPQPFSDRFSVGRKATYA
jgi:hypothetical protein